MMPNPKDVKETARMVRIGFYLVGRMIEHAVDCWRGNNETAMEAARSVENSVRTLLSEKL